MDIFLKELDMANGITSLMTEYEFKELDMTSCKHKRRYSFNTTNDPEAGLWMCDECGRIVNAPLSHILKIWIRLGVVFVIGVVVSLVVNYFFG